MAVTAYKSPGTLSSQDRDSKPAWSNPGNAASSNDSYATCALTSSYGDWLRGVNYNFTTADIPAGSTIDGIEFQIERKANGTNRASDSAIFMRKTSGQVGNSQAVGTTWTASDVVATYGGATSLMGTSWTESDIVGNSDFGIDLSMAAAAAVTGSVDHMQIRIYFTEASGDITGTVSATAAPATGSVSGGVEVSGTISGAASPTTASVAGGVAVVGEISGTAAQVTGSVAGAVIVSGSVSATSAPATGAVAGMVLISGALNAAVAQAVSAVAGAVAIVGSIVADAAPTTALVNGLVESDTRTGTVAAIAAPATGAVAGAVAIQGAVSANVAQILAALEGAVAISGAINATAAESSAMVVGSVSELDLFGFDFDVSFRYK